MMVPRIITFSVIKGLAEKFPQVIAVNLSKNFGQDAALMAGYTYSTGDYIISLDDDCQNPPAEAHKLIAKIEEGYDAVFGKYHVKQHSAFKNWGSRLNDKMATMLLKKPKDLTLCSYFIMNSFVACLISSACSFLGSSWHAAPLPSFGFCAFGPLWSGSWSSSRAAAFACAANSPRRLKRSICRCRKTPVFPVF